MQGNFAVATHGIQQIDEQAGNLAYSTPVGARNTFFKAVALSISTLLVIAIVPGKLECLHHMRCMRRLSFKPVNNSTQHESGIASELTSASGQAQFIEQFSWKPAYGSTQNVSGMVSDLANVSEQRQITMAYVDRLSVCNHGRVSIRLGLRQEPAHATSLIVGPWLAVGDCLLFDKHQLAQQWMDGWEILCFFLRKGESELHRCSSSHRVYYRRNSKHVGFYYCSGSITECKGFVIG